MLDVILYGRDRSGLLTLHECILADLRELAHIFRHLDSDVSWEWAEVESREDDGRTRIVKYTADSLRAMVVNSSRTPSLN